MEFHVVESVEVVDDGDMEVIKPNPGKNGLHEQEVARGGLYKKDGDALENSGAIDGGKQAL